MGWGGGGKSEEMKLKKTLLPNNNPIHKAEKFWDDKNNNASAGTCGSYIGSGDGLAPVWAGLIS